MRSAPSRRATLVLAAAVSVSGLAACGSSHTHDALAPTTTSPTPSSTSTSTTTPAVVAHHRRPAPIVAPLTGLPTDKAVTHRPAVVIKIDNLQAALPQTGPDQADVVYEEMVEGGLTRLAVVFQSIYPNPVGPVRSGRLTDEGIADDLNHPVLSYAGANSLFQPQLAAQPVTDVDDDTNPDLFVRNYTREAPHNLYSDIAGLAATDTTSAPPKALWAFRPAGRAFAGARVTKAASVAITFPAAAVAWNWDRQIQKWVRTQNGALDVDSHGQPLTARNVIVQWIPYITSAVVTGEGAGANGGPIPEGEFVGSGTAWYLSGGAVVKGTWSRASLTARTVYKDAKGHPIRLEPGRTWVELPEVGSAASTTP